VFFLALSLAGCHSGGLDITCKSGQCSQAQADLAQASLDGALRDLAVLPKGSISLTIPKTGAPFTGATTDPGLNDPSQCPDANLEPDDDLSSALNAPPLVPDMPTSKIIKMAICPTGNNPFTGHHDVDVYKIDNSTGPASLTLQAEIFYDISMGDLDVAIVDSSGNVLSEDGTAVTNGCAAALISNAVYYAVVVGANNVDSNRYEILIRSFTTQQTCPTT
jgi:hypothetical protein